MLEPSVRGNLECKLRIEILTPSGYSFPFIPLPFLGKGLEEEKARHL